MRRILSVVFVASAMFAGALFAAEALKSGLQPGDAPPAYNVKDCTGPSEGKSLCYRCKYGARPAPSGSTHRATATKKASASTSMMRRGMARSLALTGRRVRWRSLDGALAGARWTARSLALAERRARWRSLDGGHWVAHGNNTVRRCIQR